MRNTARTGFTRCGHEREQELQELTASCRIASLCRGNHQNKYNIKYKLQNILAELAFKAAATRTIRQERDLRSENVIDNINLRIW